MPRRVTKIGVEEEQVPGGRPAFPAIQEAHRLGAGLHRGALAARRAVTDHGSACPFGQNPGLVMRAGVDEHDEIRAGQPEGRPHGAADLVGLVPGRGDHGDVTGWRHGPILM